MKTLYLAFRLLWKRKLYNFILIVQVLFSIIMISPLVLTLEHTLALRDAMNGLNPENTYFMYSFDYSLEPQIIEDVTARILESEHVEAIGTLIYSAAYIDGRIVAPTEYVYGEYHTVLLYNNALIQRYSPALKAGKWFTELPADFNGIPAVVTEDSKLNVGDPLVLPLHNGLTLNCVVCGIIPGSAPYLAFSFSASVESYTADKLFARNRGVILPMESVVGNLDANEQSGFLPSFNRLIYTKDSSGDEWLKKEIGKFGEIMTLAQAKAQYTAQINATLTSDSVRFAIYMLIAFIGIYGNNLMQNIYNRKLFLIYYLAGANWKRTIRIEAARVLITILTIMVLVLLCGRWGLWESIGVFKDTALLHYLAILAYLIAVFAAASVGFFIRLARGNLSEMLKKFTQES